MKVAEKLSLNKSSAEIHIGETIKLTVKNTTETVKWYSSNKNIAAASQKGEMTGKNVGTTTITAKVGNKKVNLQNFSEKGGKSHHKPNRSFG